MRHLLRLSSLTRSEILAILSRARDLRCGGRPWQSPGGILGLLFFQPSTRTRFGFHAAMARLGGAAITLEETKWHPGMTEPESLEDTLRSIGDYCDVLVLRHAAHDSVVRAAAVLKRPLINGGNGTDEHPTQALIDLFAICEAHESLDGLIVGIAGDLRDSRAAHSLLSAFAVFPPAELRLMYPPSRAPAAELLKPLGIPITKSEEGLRVEDLDVLYMAGLPEGRGSDALGDEVRSRFCLTLEAAQRLPGHAVVLSPLPCIDEIDRRVGELQVARYYRQSSDGLYVRISVLEQALTWVRAMDAGPSVPATRSLAS